MALSKEEMRQKLRELSEEDRGGLVGVLQEGLEERRKSEGISKAERGESVRLEAIDER